MNNNLNNFYAFKSTSGGSGSSGGGCSIPAGLITILILLAIGWLGKEGLLFPVIIILLLVLLVVFKS